MRARIAFFCWSVSGPWRAVSQSVVGSVWIRAMPARASAENGVPARKSGQLWLDVRFGISVSAPQSAAGNSSIERSP
jgi:hypothetical protein